MSNTPVTEEIGILSSLSKSEEGLEKGAYGIGYAAARKGASKEALEEAFEGSKYKDFVLNGFLAAKAGK